MLWPYIPHVSISIVVISYARSVIETWEKYPEIGKFSMMCSRADFHTPFLVSYKPLFIPRYQVE